MALQQATAGGEWLSTQEWLDLGAEKALVVFRVKAHLPEKPMDNGPVFPVECDVLIVSGSREGELHTGQQPIGKGLTTPLRKVKPGNDMVAEMGIGQRKGSNQRYPQANPPAPEDFQGIAAMFADGRDPFVEAERAQNGTGLVATPQDDAPAAEVSTIGAGAPAAGTRPWNRKAS